MRDLKYIVATVITAFCLTVSITSAYAFEPEDVIVEDAPTPDMSAVTPVTEGNVTYLTGGIGASESIAMRINAKKYPLEIVFVEKSGALEEYLSEVKLQIQDATKNAVLDITTEGPFFLADLPQGKYIINAEYHGELKTQVVTVNKKKHEKIVFWWRALE